MKKLLAIVLLCTGVTGYGQSMPCVADSCCLEGTVWSEELGGCVVANPSDSNFDGCVALNDLLDFLSAYGNCGSEGSPCQGVDIVSYQGYDYEIVEIGGQCWFAENLKAENYRNGEAIHSDLGNDQWGETNEGAFAESVPDYGLLYNWYAVDDARQLCPEGWSVPSDEDFTELVEFLGSETAGIQLKSTSGWYLGNGSNSSGFNGYPNGIREWNGGVYDVGARAWFWSSTANSPNGGVYRSLSNTDIFVTSDWRSSVNGMSIRCVKEIE